MLKIGVLAMQGAFEEHIKVLKKLDIETKEVKTKKDLENLDGLIIPGGESTAIGKLLEKYNMTEQIREMGKSGFPIFGTCAGMIMLSKEIEHSAPGQQTLGLLNIVARRNAFGRQIDSFETDLDVPELGEPAVHAVFIRAPVVSKIGNNVKVLARLEDKIVAVLEGNILATAFHPELTEDPRFHKFFIEIAGRWKKEHGKN